MTNVARKGLAFAALLALPLAAWAESFPTANNTAKISRVRLDSVGRAFVGIAQTPDAPTNDCPPGIFQSELYYFDTTTLQGRILYNQILAAFTSQSKVAGSGNGNPAGDPCFVTGVSPFFSRYERLVNFTVFFP